MGKIKESVLDILGGEAAVAAMDEIFHSSPLMGEGIDEAMLPEDAMIQEIDARNVSLDNTGRTLCAYDYSDFIARKARSRELLLAPFLPQAGLAMLYAMRGVGKTHVALGIGWAVAAGGSFLRWQALAPHRVLYIDGEMPAAAMQERIRTLVESSGMMLPKKDYFRIITPDFQTGQMPDIATRDGQQMIEEYLEGVELVVVDNLSTLCRRVKENEADSWEPVQEWALSLRQRGKSLLLVHHAGRSGQARGTSRREDILDSVLLLKRPDDYKPIDGARFEIHYEKARGFFGEEATSFEAFFKSENGKRHWIMRDIGVSPQESARAMVAQGMTQRQAGRMLGVSRSAVSKWMNQVTP